PIVAIEPTATEMRPARQLAGDRDGASEPLRAPSELVQARAVLLRDEFPEPVLLMTDLEHLQPRGRPRLELPLRPHGPNCVGVSVAGRSLPRAAEEGGATHLLQIQKAIRAGRVPRGDKHGEAAQAKATDPGDAEDDVHDLEDPRSTLVPTAAFDRL